MFTVTGRMRDTAKPYDVQVDDLRPPDLWGIVRGTSDALALLMGLDGQGVAASPTGPFYKLNRHAEDSILAALVQHTEVLAVGGEPPDISGDLPAGAVG